MVERQMIAEADLIHQAKNGDTNAYGDLYQRHFDAIYSYIYRRVTVVCEAEDLAQVVFLKAWQAIKDYQPSVTPFRGWLYRIAHNTVVDHYRTQKKNLQWEDLSTVADSAITPESAILETERNETIRGALSTLHPSYREVITHRFIDEKDYAESAEALGRKVNNVRVLQHRALNALRRTLNQQSALWVALAATAITLFFGTTIVRAAAYALPDERLYPVRTLVEDARLALADDAADVELHVLFANQRVTDLQTLSQEERVKAMDETVAQLASHVTSASVKANELSRTDIGDLAPTVLVEQMLLEQEVSLAELEFNAAPATIEYVQSAIDAVMDAGRQLHRENAPSTIYPLNVDPAGSEHGALFSAPTEGRIHSTVHVTGTISTETMAAKEPVLLDSGDQSVTGGSDTTLPESRPETSIPKFRSAEPASDTADSPSPSDAVPATGLPHAAAGEEKSDQAPDYPPAGTATLPDRIPHSAPEAAHPQNRPEPAGQTGDRLPVSQEVEEPSDSNPAPPAHGPQTDSTIVDGEQPDTIVLPNAPSPDASYTGLPSLEDGHYPTEPPLIGEPEEEQVMPNPTPASGPDSTEDHTSEAPRTGSLPEPPKAATPLKSD